MFYGCNQQFILVFRFYWLTIWSIKCQKIVKNAQHRAQRGIILILYIVCILVLVFCCNSTSHCVHLSLFWFLSQMRLSCNPDTEMWFGSSCRLHRLFDLIVSVCHGHLCYSQHPYCSFVSANVKSGKLTPLIFNKTQPYYFTDELLTNRQNTWNIYICILTLYKLWMTGS